MEPIIVSSSSAQTGTALSVLRHRLLETLGFFWTGTVSSLAASLEAERYVICSGMRSDKWPASHLDGLYTWVRTGAQARTARSVVNGSFDGTNGAWQVDYPYDAALAVGTFVEIGVLPAEKYLGAEGANHILNLALETLPVIDFVPVTVVANQSQYSFIGYPWPIKGVASVVYPRTSTTNESRIALPGDSWSFVNDGESPVLSFGSVPATAGDVLDVGLIRPGNTRIKSGGTWGDSTTGLSLEDDECLYDAKTVINIARPIALERLGLLYREGSPERAEFDRKASEASIDAGIARFYGSFRGGGRQRVGVSGGSRSWSKSWRP